MIYCNTEVKEGRVRDDGLAGPHYKRKGKAEKREKKEKKEERWRKALLRGWMIGWGW